MADPVSVSCTVGGWTKVATAVTSVTIHVLKTDPDLYAWTYRLTGTAAPTVLAGDGVPFDGSLPLVLSASSDVYVWPIGAAGSVRVDV